MYSNLDIVHHTYPLDYLQMAIPQILYCLDSPSDFDKRALQDVAYLWNLDRTVDSQKKYSHNTSGHHPWKTGGKVEEMQKILEAMSAGDPSLTFKRSTWAES